MNHLERGDNIELYPLEIQSIKFAEDIMQLYNNSLTHTNKLHLTLSNPSIRNNRQPQADPQINCHLTYGLPPMLWDLIYECENKKSKRVEK